MNDDLLAKISAIIKDRDAGFAATHFYWCKGHSGDYGNEQADRLANMASKSSRNRLCKQVGRGVQGVLSMVQVWCWCDEMYVGRMACEQPYVHDDRSHVYT
ncbi:hypothetical protein EJ04DRAFT_22417 [Polyplosphaeria fusca]|uniref:RNase H type-1 domain-containing protein n=1 Tax=Polyplosphaeria fusca TaxID=682080 RepID=A0A9P4QP04_9PLEO|nr:hypothetical protein EJ04DRAFT_22417 [Polyplosphaeria fusca]